MGFFDRKAEDLAVRFIGEFTGQSVVPKVCVPCESSHTPNWKGYCVLTEDSLFLVNKYGARGILYEHLSGTGSWGQYPQGTKGFPNFRFGFLFNGRPGAFTVFSKTLEGGRQLNDFLKKIYTPNE
jgi:hypothetical protein